MSGFRPASSILLQAGNRGHVSYCQAKDGRLYNLLNDVVWNHGTDIALCRIEFGERSYGLVSDEKEKRQVV